MTKIKVTYIAIDKESNTPILSAGSFEELRDGLDEYYGVVKGEAECFGFHPYQTKYPDDYVGFYTYKRNKRYEKDDGFDMIKVWCVNYYPHTEY